MARNGAIGKRRIFGKPGIIAAASEASSIAMWRPFYYLPLRLTNQLGFSNWPVTAKRRVQ
jgi:hypothetical protein